MCTIDVHNPSSDVLPLEIHRSVFSLWGSVICLDPYTNSLPIWMVKKLQNVSTLVSLCIIWDEEPQIMRSIWDHCWYRDGACRCFPPHQKVSPAGPEACYNQPSCQNAGRLLRYASNPNYPFLEVEIPTYLQRVQLIYNHGAQLICIYGVVFKAFRASFFRTISKGSHGELSMYLELDISVSLLKTLCEVQEFSGLLWFNLKENEFRIFGTIGFNSNWASFHLRTGNY